MADELRERAYARLGELEAEAFAYLSPQERGLARILSEWRGMDESETQQEQAMEVLAALASLLAPKSHEVTLQTIEHLAWRIRACLRGDADPLKVNAFAALDEIASRVPASEHPEGDYRCAKCGNFASVHPVDIDGPGAGQQVRCDTPAPEPDRTMLELAAASNLLIGWLRGREPRDATGLWLDRVSRPMSAEYPTPEPERCRDCGRTEFEHTFGPEETPHGFWPASREAEHDYGCGCAECKVWGKVASREAEREGEAARLRLTSLEDAAHGLWEGADPYTGMPGFDGEPHDLPAWVDLTDEQRAWWRNMVVDYLWQPSWKDDDDPPPDESAIRMVAVVLPTATPHPEASPKNCGLCGTPYVYPHNPMADPGICRGCADTAEGLEYMGIGPEASPAEREAKPMIVQLAQQVVDYLATYSWDYAHDTEGPGAEAAARIVLRMVRAQAGLSTDIDAEREVQPGKDGASAFVQECQRKVSGGELLSLLEAGGLIELAYGNPHVYRVGQRPEREAPKHGGPPMTMDEIVEAERPDAWVPKRSDVPGAADDDASCTRNGEAS